MPSKLREYKYTARLLAEIACCGCSTNLKEILENDPQAYFVHDELLAPLRIMYNSLMETGDDSIANGRLLDAMRQVQLLPPLCSCMCANHFAPIESSRH